MPQHTLLIPTNNSNVACTGIKSVDEIINKFEIVKDEKGNEFRKVPYDVYIYAIVVDSYERDRKIIESAEKKYMNSSLDQQLDQEVISIADDMGFLYVSLISKEALCKVSRKLRMIDPESL